MYYDIIYGKLTTIDREITARCIAIINRSDPDLVRYMQYHIDRCDPSKGDLQVGEGIWSGIDQQHSGSPRPATSL
jgi:fatty acid synthase subunit beta